ncbi:MAG: hypothetical protein NZ601_05950 [candidate division WOR-3 bacterium]|nr:hypothetical protein [candidate division WOR-3 bacterium]
MHNTNHKKIKTIIMSLLITAFVLNIYALEVKLTNEVWNRYLLERKDGQTTKSQISLDRGYLTLEPTLNDQIKGRFTLDFFSSDKYNDGGGLKVKYGYLQFSKLLPVSENNLEIGLLKNYFGIVYDWEYPVIEKALEDKEKVVASADYGVAFTGLLPQGLGEYAFGIYNGEGYTKTQTKVNKNFAYLFNMRLIPIAGITLGGSLLTDRPGFIGLVRDTTTTTRAESVFKNVFDKRRAFSTVAKFAFGPIEVWGEYLKSYYDSTITKKVSRPNIPDTVTDISYIYKSHGYSVTPIISLSNLVNFDGELVLRFDYWDPNRDVRTYANFTTTLGFNYILIRSSSASPILTIQANWSRKFYKKEDPQVTDKKPEDQVGIQLKWKYNVTITN